MTWINIKGLPIKGDQATKTFKEHKLIAADKFGVPVETGTSLMDIGRRLVQIRKEAKQTQDSLEVVVRAQLEENEHLRGDINKLDKDIDMLLESTDVAVRSLREDLTRLETELNDLSVFEDMTLINKRILEIDRRLALAKEQVEVYINRHVQRLYNDVREEVYSLKKCIDNSHETQQADIYKLQLRIWKIGAFFVLVNSLIFWELFS